MSMDGLSPSEIACFFGDGSGGGGDAVGAGALGPDGKPRKKMVNLHWDKMEMDEGTIGNSVFGRGDAADLVGAKVRRAVGGEWALIVDCGRGEGATGGGRGVGFGC